MHCSCILCSGCQRRILSSLDSMQDYYRTGKRLPCWVIFYLFLLIIVEILVLWFFILPTLGSLSLFTAQLCLYRSCAFKMGQAEIRWICDPIIGLFRPYKETYTPLYISLHTVVPLPRIQAHPQISIHLSKCSTVIYCWYGIYCS